MNNPKLLACVCAGMSIELGQLQWYIDQQEPEVRDFGLDQVENLLESTIEAIEAKTGRELVELVFSEIKHENLDYHR